MQDEKTATTTSGYPMLVALPVAVITGVSAAWVLGAIALKILGLLVAILALILSLIHI